MDKDTAVALTEIKARVTACELRLDTEEEERAAWKAIVREAIKSVLKALGTVIMAGLLFGWHLPENVRKSIMEYLTK